MADVGLIGAENIEALLNTSMDADDGPADPNSNLDLMEEAILIQDTEEETTDKTEDSLKMGLTANTETEIVEGVVNEVQIKEDEQKLEETSAVESEPTVVNDEDLSSPEEIESVPTKAVTVVEEEVEDVEDDIICLDDEESGVSDSKRPRKDDDEIMEVDEDGVISKDEKESVGRVIRRMSRQDLEDLVLAKIVEAIVAHTEVGQLRAKVLELQLQKDKMASKMGVMMKQVAELSNAVQIILENETRDPKNRIGKPHVIRFNRSVGLQTIIEPSVRTAPPKIIRVPEAPQNGMKSTPSAKGASNSNITAGTFATPQPTAVKRVFQGGKANEKTQNTVNSSPRKTYSAASGPQRMLPIAPKPPTSSLTITPTQLPPPPVPVAQPGIVDLTDDDPPPSSNSQNLQSSVAGQTTIINGVQYQIVNRSATASGGVQLVSPGGAASQKSFIITPGGSAPNRPVVLQQLGVGSTSQQQQVVYRGNAPVNKTVAPRPPPNGNLPRVAATIPVRPGGSVLGATTNTPRRFVLPPLPLTPPPKAKNDFYKAPPKPELTLNEQADGIVLSWNLPTVNNMAEVTTYQIFACQESLNSATNRPSQWKRVGDVKALPLPMACTLSQFTEENRYYFIVRGIDVYGRVGPFCDPQNILLRRKK